MLLQTDTNSYDARDPEELWSVGVQEYPLAEGNISITIEDLDGRLLLNKLVDQEGNPDSLYRERFIRLCNELGLDNSESLVDALIDWLDPDQVRSPAGAEDNDYLTERPAYEATDGPLLSFDELRLVRGFNSATVELLRPHVSVFGSGKLNINTASPELLRSWDAEAAMAVEMLLDRRTAGPFKKLDELREVLGVENFTAINRNLDLLVTSVYYQISSHGRINDGARRIQAIVNKNDDLLLWQKVN
jgi:general secretion pathway protein K